MGRIDARVRSSFCAVLPRSLQPCSAPLAVRTLASRLDSAGAVEFEQVEGEKELATFPIGETYLELLESDKPDTGTSRWIAQHGDMRGFSTSASRSRISTLQWPSFAPRV